MFRRSLRVRVPSRYARFALIFVVAASFYGLGTYQAESWNTLRIAESQAQIDALRAQLVRRLTPRGVWGSGESAARTAGISGWLDPIDPSQTAGLHESLVEEVKRRLQTEMGLVPVKLLRECQRSFVELYAVDNRGKTSYGTAGYIGHGHFVTVKHGVIALRTEEEEATSRRIVSVSIIYRGQAVAATVVDSGDADTEVHAGDWAIIRVETPIDLPPLRVDPSYAFEFADPILRLGNDYSKGVILSTGYVGQRTPNGLVTCLTDGHPGVSGGGILDQQGNLVGIPIGRMQGDFRFSFILPLRREMFRRTPNVL